MTNTSQLLETAEKTILFTAARPELVMERGKGMYLWDTEGKAYLDFVGGWAVNCLGHSPAVLQEALTKQAGELVHASPGYYNKPMIELAELLTSISCFDRAFFASSGSEANEGAIKLARKYGSLHLNGAFEVITVSNGFHGRTLAAMAATGKPEWAHLFAPQMPGFKHMPLNDFEACEAMVTDNTCAIMLELIQGEGGIYEVDAEYLHKLRKLCDERGMMLIFDEIQTGIGRTGTMFAYQQYDVEADVMTLGKGLGGGFPMSAMLVKEKFNVFELGNQGGTYTGQPLAAAAGLAVVREVIRRSLPEHAERMGKRIVERLLSMEAKYGLTDIRGRGLLLAFDLPEADSQRLAGECLAGGLLINAPKPYTIRLMPPLIVTEAEIDTMFDRLCAALDRIYL